MPHISIKMYPGRSEEVKRELAEKTKECVMEQLNIDGNFISVSVEEIEKENWQTAVVDPIKAEELYVEANF